MVGGCAHNVHYFTYNISFSNTYIFMDEINVLRFNFYPRPFLAFGYGCCLCMCVWVCFCVCESRVCPHDNSSPIQTRITKFGPKVQNNLFKISIVWSGDWSWLSRLKSNFKVKFYPSLSLKIVGTLRSLSFWRVIDLDLNLRSNLT